MYPMYFILRHNIRTHLWARGSMAIRRAVVLEEGPLARRFSWYWYHLFVK